jgi:hypothetical protein
VLRLTNLGMPDKSKTKKPLEANMKPTMSSEKPTMISFLSIFFLLSIPLASAGNAGKQCKSLRKFVIYSLKFAMIMIQAQTWHSSHFS